MSTPTTTRVSVHASWHDRSEHFAKDRSVTAKIDVPTYADAEAPILAVVGETTYRRLPDGTLVTSDHRLREGNRLEEYDVWGATSRKEALAELGRRTEGLAIVDGHAFKTTHTPALQVAVGCDGRLNVGAGYLTTNEVALCWPVADFEHAHKVSDLLLGLTVADGVDLGHEEALTGREAEQARRYNQAEVSLPNPDLLGESEAEHTPEVDARFLYVRARLAQAADDYGRNPVESNLDALRDALGAVDTLSA